MAEGEDVSGIALGLSLDTSGWSTGIAKAKAELASLEKAAQGITIGGGVSGVQKVSRRTGGGVAVAATDLPFSPAMKVNRSHVRDLKTQINEHFSAFAQQGQAVGIPIKLARIPYGQIRSQIAAGIGEVPIKVRITGVAGGSASSLNAFLSVNTGQSMGKVEQTMQSARASRGIPPRAMGGAVRYAQSGVVHRSAPGAIVARMTPQQLDFVGNLRTVAARITPEQRDAGRIWYAEAQKYVNALAKQHNMPRDTVRGVVAALSAGTAWTSNKTKAQRVLTQHNQQGFWGSGGFPYGMNLDAHRKAVAILGGMKPHEAFRTSPKVSQFYRNLGGDLNAVTLDRWAFRSATQGHLSNYSEGPLRRPIDRAFRQVAREMGMSPVAFQAAAWLNERETNPPPAGRQRRHSTGQMALDLRHRARGGRSATAWGHRSDFGITAAQYRADVAGRQMQEHEEYREDRRGLGRLPRDFVGHDREYASRIPDDLNDDQWLRDMDTRPPKDINFKGGMRMYSVPPSITRRMPKPYRLSARGGPARRRGYGGTAFRPADPNLFHRAISSAALVEKSNKRLVGETVHVYSPEEYAAMRTYLSRDAKTGYAVKPDGDLVSVFNVGQKGAGRRAIRSAIQRGATKLDAFDEVANAIRGYNVDPRDVQGQERGRLPALYGKHGFREVGRDKWDPQYAPEGWRGGKPDVVYMARKHRAKGGAIEDLKHLFPRANLPGRLVSGSSTGMVDDGHGGFEEREGRGWGEMRKHLSERQMREIVEAATPLAKRYPLTASRLARIGFGTTERAKNNISTLARTYSSNWDRITQDEGGPQFDPNRRGETSGATSSIEFQNRIVAHARQQARNAAMDKKWPGITRKSDLIDPSLGGIFTHEYAHAVDSMHETSPRYKLPASTISKYAGTGIGENFAEAFTGHERGKFLGSMGPQTKELLDNISAREKYLMQPGMSESYNERRTREQGEGARPMPSVSTEAMRRARERGLRGGGRARHRLFGGFGKKKAPEAAPVVEAPRVEPYQSPWVRAAMDREGRGVLSGGLPYKDMTEEWDEPVRSTRRKYQARGGRAFWKRGPQPPPWPEAMVGDTPAILDRLRGAPAPHVEVPYQSPWVRSALAHTLPYKDLTEEWDEPIARINHKRKYQALGGRARHRDKGGDALRRTLAESGTILPGQVDKSQNINREIGIAAGGTAESGGALVLDPLSSHWVSAPLRTPTYQERQMADWDPNSPLRNRLRAERERRASEGLDAQLFNALDPSDPTTVFGRMRRGVAAATAHIAASPPRTITRGLEGIDEARARALANLSARADLGLTGPGPQRMRFQNPNEPRRTRAKVPRGYHIRFSPEWNSYPDMSQFLESSQDIPVRTATFNRGQGYVGSGTGGHFDSVRRQFASVRDYLTGNPVSGAGQNEAHPSTIRADNPHMRQPPSLTAYAIGPRGETAGYAQLSALPVRQDYGRHAGQVEQFLHPEFTWVDPAHQRKGLASAMYQKAEAFTGMQIAPSNSQTEFGQALWSKPRSARPFGKSFKSRTFDSDAQEQVLKVEEEGSNSYLRGWRPYSGFHDVDTRRGEQLIDKLLRKKRRKNDLGVLARPMWPPAMPAGSRSPAFEDFDLAGDDDQKTFWGTKRLGGGLALTGYCHVCKSNYRGSQAEHNFTAKHQRALATKVQRHSAAYYQYHEGARPSWMTHGTDDGGDLAGADWDTVANHSSLLRTEPRRMGGRGRRRAEGGYIVGEIGAERFVPQSLEHMIPPRVMDQIPQMAGGGMVDIPAGSHYWEPPEDGWIIPNRLMGQVPRAEKGNGPKGRPKSRNQRRDQEENERRQAANKRTAAEEAVTPPGYGAAHDAFAGTPEQQRNDKRTRDREAREAAEQEQFAIIRGRQANSSVDLSGAQAEHKRLQEFSAFVPKVRAQTDQEFDIAERQRERGMLTGGFTSRGIIGRMSAMFGGGKSQQMRGANEYKRDLAEYKGMAPKNQDAIDYFGSQARLATVDLTRAGAGAKEAGDQLRVMGKKTATNSDLWDKSSKSLKEWTQLASSAAGSLKDADAGSGRAQELSARLQGEDKAAQGNPLRGLIALNIANMGYQVLGKAIGGVMDAGEAAIGNFIDQSRGFSSLSNKTTNQLGAAIKEMGGNADKAFATLAGAAGVSGEGIKFLQASLGPTAIAKAGAATGTQTADLFRSTQGPQSTPQGLYGGYGGVLGGSLFASQMGGGPGLTQVIGDTLKAFSVQPTGPSLLNQTYDKFGGGGKGVPSLAGMSPADTATVVSTGIDVAGLATGAINSIPVVNQVAQGDTSNPISSLLGALPVAGPMYQSASGAYREVSKAATPTEAGRAAKDDAGRVADKASTEYIGTFNDAAKRMVVSMGGAADSAFRFDKATAAQAQAVKASGLPQEMKDIAEKGYVLKNAQGQLVTSTVESNKGMLQMAQGLTILDKDAFAQLSKRQLGAQFETTAAQSELQRNVMIPGQLGQQLLENPLLPASTGMALGGLSKGDQAKVQKTLDSIAKDQADLTKQGLAAVSGQTDFIRQNIGGDQADQFTQLMTGAKDSVQSYGKQIADLNTQIANRNAKLGFAQYSNSLRILNRDLTAAKAMANPGASGTNNLGAIQRQQFELSQQSTQLGLQLSQRQINFNVAVAGFQAPGITGQERGARVQEAQLEASYAQKQQNIGVKEFKLQRPAFELQAQYSVTDLQFQKSIMAQTHSVEQQNLADNKVISNTTIKMGQTAAKANTILGNASTNYGTVLSTASDYVGQFGGSIKDATDALRKALGMTAIDRGTSATTPKPKDRRNAVGFIGTASRPTSLGTYGEAGTESAFVLRNPRPAQLSNFAGGSGGGGTNITVVVTGNQISNAMDLDKVGHKLVAMVEEALGRKAALLGVRSA